MKYLNTKIVVLKYQLPLAEIIVGFYDALKFVSKGYASFDYEHIDPQKGDLVKHLICTGRTRCLLTFRRIKY